MLAILFFTACDKHEPKDISFLAIDGTTQNAIYIQGNETLIVDIHSWSSNRHKVYKNNGYNLADEARKIGWSYIRPEARGANDNPDACCSEKVISDIDRSIDYVVKKQEIKNLVLVGVSGGGYTSLCYLADGKYRPDYTSVWNAITDLQLWSEQSKETRPRYSEMVQACTLGDYNERSPLYNIPSDISQLDIYAGTKDDRVPKIHSELYYEQLKSKNAELHILDIGHEMLIPEVVKNIKKIISN